MDASPFGIASRMPGFDSMRNERARNFVKALSPHFADSETGNALDFGCGHNEVRKTLVHSDKYPGSWFAVDVYKGFPDPCTRFVLTDPAHPIIPFASELMDNIVAVSVLHHIPNQLHQDTISEFLRILRHGGKLIVIEDFIGCDTRIPALEACVHLADRLMNSTVPGGAYGNQKSIIEWANLIQDGSFQYLTEDTRIFTTIAAGCLPWKNVLMVFEKG